MTEECHICRYTAYIKDQKLHKVEPYVYSQMVAGKDAFRPSEGKNSWLTGTAAWNYYTITQFILGIKPTYKTWNPLLSANSFSFLTATLAQVNEPKYPKMRFLTSLTVIFVLSVISCCFFFIQSTTLIFGL